MYVRTDDDVMAIKPRFFAWMGYHIFLTVVLLLRTQSSTIIWATAITQKKSNSDCYLPTKCPN